MKLRESDLSNLIGQIYDAAQNAQLWGRFLESAADALEAGASALLHQDRRSQNDQVAVSIRLDPDLVRQYLEHYASVNPWVVTAEQKGLLHDGCILPGQTIVPEAELRKTEFYSDFLTTFGGVHNLGVNVFLEESRMTNLTFHRAESQSSFGEEEVRFLQLLLPHLKRAMQIHRRVASIDLMASAAFESLEALPHGVVLVTSTGRVVFANRAAREILSARDGLSLTGGQLHAASSAQTARLQSMLARAAQTAVGAGPHSGGTLALTRPSLKRPLMAVVAPLKGLAIAIQGQHPSAVLFLADPERSLPQEPERLVELFHLTPAEARFALLLMEGRSVSEAAESLSIALETARTHVKRIHSKTGVRSQGALVSLLHRSLAGYRFS